MTEFLLTKEAEDLQAEVDRLKAERDAYATMAAAYKRERDAALEKLSAAILARGGE